MPTKEAPAYRKRDDRNQAIVTLTDRRTRVRRDYYLGPYGSPESRELYYRLLAEWESSGGTLPGLPEQPGETQQQVTVSEVALAYWKHCEAYYHNQESQCSKVIIRLLRQFFGETPAVEFGPKKLRFLREQMIRGDAKADPPRVPWSRKYINHQFKRLCRMFKWAASQEMLPASIHQQLATVEPLKRGRSEARESPSVKPVSMECVDAVRPHLSRQAEALIDLQILDGGPGGELFNLRPMDIEKDEHSGVWTYKPIEHKTAYREKHRVIIFGPRAQEIIGRFLENRPRDAYLFSPSDAEAERRERLRHARKTPLSCGNVTGSNRQKVPQRQPGDRYTRGSYLVAIYRACDRAFAAPEHLRPRKRDDGKMETRAQWQARLTESQKADLKAWRKSHRWHPHQLRHVAGTELRRRFGLEVAQLVLGHSSAQITDAVYADRDITKILEVMRQVG